MEQALYRDPFDNIPRRKARPVEKGRDPYDGLRPWSAVTHGAGAALGVLATVALAVGAARLGDVWKIVSFAIYGLSMVGLYTASTLYHCVNTTVKGRVALRKADHTSIYFLIAGSYTPVCLIALRGAWGWSLFGHHRHLPPVAGAGAAGSGLAAGGRRAVHCGRRALCPEVAGAGQPPVWLPRGVPSIHPAGLRGPFRDDV